MDAQGAAKSSVTSGCRRIDHPGERSYAPGWMPRAPSLRPGLRTLGVVLLAACATPSPRWVRTELFLGRNLPDGGTLSAGEVDAFLAREAGPRLQGWTVLEARGHWTGPDGGLVDEPTSVLVVLHPPGSDEASLEEIRRAYVEQHGQDSVLRVDMPAGASFDAGARHERPLALRADAGRTP